MRTPAPTPTTTQTPSRRDALIARLRELEEAETRACDSFYGFIRWSWPYVEQQRAFRDNWHIGAIAEHLEAVALGQILRLGVNVPPATGKSTIISVQFPAWIWTRRKSERTGPGMRFMCTSYDQTQSNRDSQRMRDLIQHPWYTSRWGVELRDDQNLKTKFGNTSGGWRIAASMLAPRMGEHPNFKIFDDPHNPKKQLLSDTEIAQANQSYDFNFKIRGEMMNAATILVMQRLHEKDLCGHIQETSPEGWHWLILPMRWEPKRMVQLPTGWKDPREGQPGALLWPTEWTEEKVNNTYKPGTWGDAGQFQQRPAPTGGLLFKRDWFRIVNALPADVTATVRSWDIAASEEKEGGSARTAGVRLARTSTGHFVITDIRKGWWNPLEVDQNMEQTARLDGPTVAIREEQEPGSAGKAIIAARRRLLAGYDYRGLPKRSDKRASARPSRSQAEAGNVLILVPTDADGRPDAAAQQWAKEFLDEVELFPAGALKDQVDAFTQALNVLTGVAEPLDIIGGVTSTAGQTDEERAEAEREMREQAEREVLDQIARNGVYWPGGR